MQGEIQYWHEGVLVLTSPNTIGRGFTVLGQPLAGGRTQTQESRMVVVAVSFVTVDLCHVIREGCSRVLDHVQLLIWLH